MKSFLETLDLHIPKQNKEKIIEMRASNAIAAVTNFMEVIKENYSAEECEELLKKFFLSVKHQNEDKFLNKIRLINESKK